jgi:hypothetical protein
VSKTYVRFRTALSQGDLDGAYKAAKALPGLLSLLDALELTLLAARKNADGLFEEWAARWLARVAVERELKLGELMGAGEVLLAAGKGEASRPYEELADLL